MTAPTSARLHIAGLMIALGLLGNLVSAAEHPEIAVSVSPEEIFAGESVDYMVEIRNTKNPSAPDMSPVKQEFDVVSAGDESRNQSSTYIINGKVTQQNIFGHVYLFRLTPKKTGLLTIPAVSATIDGKTLTSDPLPLNVIAVEKQDVVLVEVEADHDKVYPTQPFKVVVRVLVQPLPNGADRDPLTPLRRQPPHLQINWVDPPAGLSTEEKSRWLQPLLSDEGIGFTLNDVTTRSGFFIENSRAVFNLFQRRETRTGLNGKKIRYFVYELSRSFTPERTGEYTFGPALIKGAFVTAVDGNGYAARRLVASSQSVSVEVRDVPSPRPSTYCGGIGDYKVRASASPTKLRVGDPLTLTIELERGSQSGSLDLISAPDLSAIPQLLNDFDLIDKSSTGRVEGMVKKFSFAMRPKHTKAAIPAMTLHTFDPDREEFVPLQTNSIALEVAEATQMAAGDLIGTTPSKGTAEIKSRAQGIFQNVTNLAEIHDERFNLIYGSQVTLGIWFVAACLMAAVTYHRHKSSDAGWMRRQQSRRTANRRLADARMAASNGNAIESLRLVRSALIGLVADTRNLIPEGLTTTDIDEHLAKASTPDEDRTAIVQLLESIESAEYGATRPIEATVAIESASALIQRVYRFLERGS